MESPGDEINARDVGRQTLSLLEKAAPADLQEMRGSHSAMMACAAASYFLDCFAPDVLRHLTGLNPTRGLLWHQATEKNALTEQEVEQNSDLIMAVCLVYPDKVPSFYWCAGVLLEIDRQLDGCIYRDLASKMQAALRDGQELKKLVQYARHLTRNSPQARSPRVQMVKDCFVFQNRMPAPPRSAAQPGTFCTDTPPVLHGSDKPDIDANGPAKRLCVRGIAGLMEDIKDQPTVSTVQQNALKKAASRQPLRGEALDEGREMPANFAPEYRELYKCVPVELLPPADAQLRGKHSYTAYGPGGAVVEIQFNNRCFFVKKRTGGEPWARETCGSPQVPWNTHGSISEAWTECKRRIGGWDVLDSDRAD